MIKPTPAAFPWDAIPVTDLNLRIEHIDLLLTSWWTHATPELQVAVQPNWVLPISETLAFGEAKYGGALWLEKEEYRRASYHFNAFKRHFYASSDRDAESGLPHWYHAACRAVMLATLHARGLLIDDRPPMSAATQAKLAEFRAEQMGLADTVRERGVSN